ncbi:MAG: UbiA family prenyltransferase [Pirellulales bacterium]
MTAWLKLLRLPNVFTAAADVTMGYVITRGELAPPLQFGLLVATSCLLYLSGMVLNDVFDAAVDAVEQPHRPIPSGLISRRSAAGVGWGMMVAAIVLAWYLSFFIAHDWRPGVVATLLAAVILLYDGALKRSRFAPLLMGECRFLNVLLGMSITYIPWGKAELLIAAGIGIYIIGVTMFARNDAHTSRRDQLLIGFVVLVSGIAILAAVPYLTNHRPPLEVPTVGWYLLWLAIGLIIIRRALMAIFDPTSQRVQAAVRHCVQSIIVLDAALCVGYASPYWGFVVLAFLAPTLLLTLWLNAT